MKNLSLERIVIFLGLLSSASGYGQEAIRLKIQDQQNRPLSQAVFVSADGKFSQISDENGIIQLPAGVAQQGNVSHIGFEEKNINPQIGNEWLIHMLPKAISIQEVVLNTNAKSGIYKGISQLDLQVHPVNNSQEVLRLVPGLFIGQHAGGGKAEQLFLRGFDVDHGTDVAISVDGMPVNMVSHAHGQGYADLHFLIPEFIGQVNFDKGPYFANKGNFNTAGFVDFQTKNSLENSFIKLEAGQFDSYRAVAGLKLLPSRLKEHNLTFGTEYNFSQNYFENPQDFRRLNAFLKYYGKILPTTYLTANVSGFHSSWNASGQIPMRAVEDGTIGWFGAIDPDEGGRTSRYNASLNFRTYAPQGGRWNTRFYFTKYDFELYSNFTFFKEDEVNGDQIRQKESRFLYGSRLDYEKHISILGLPSELNAGLGMRHDETNGSELSRTLNRTKVTAPLKLGNILETNLSAYWSQRINFNNKFSVTPGLRMDYFQNKYQDTLEQNTSSQSSAIFSPKLNFEYQVNPRVSLYSYWGRGFHSNDTRVMVQRTGRQALPAAYGTDLGGIFRLGNKFLLQTALWYLQMDQEFVYVGDEAIVEEGGKTQRYGVDLMARYEVLKHLFVDINWNYAYARNILTQESQEASYIPLAPRIVSTGGLTYAPAEGLSASLMCRYMGDRPANEDGSVVAQGYTVWDATAKYNLGKFEIGMMAQNLFNVKWKETQFETESRLKNESEPVSEIHFTPGTPFFARVFITYKF